MTDRLEKFCLNQDWQDLWIFLMMFLSHDYLVHP
jgi:hypothetical protein